MKLLKAAGVRFRLLGDEWCCRASLWQGGLRDDARETVLQNVELALKWWDYLSRDVVATHTARSGPEGLTWEMVDGVPTSRLYTAEEATAFGYGDLAGHAGTSAFAASMGLTNCPPLIVNSLAPAPGTTSAIR